MRKVHLGARLTAEIAWSDSTRSAECDAIAGAVYDLVKSRLGETHLRHLADGIRAAHEHELSADRAHEFVKRHLAKADAEAAMAAFRGPDTITMPAGNTRWRLAQAISWIAGNSEDDEKRLDLQKVAGQLVPMTEAA